LTLGPAVSEEHLAVVDTGPASLPPPIALPQAVVSNTLEVTIVFTISEVTAAAFIEAIVMVATPLVGVT
jgi:hypothetical protein